MFGGGGQRVAVGTEHDAADRAGVTVQSDPEPDRPRASERPIIVSEGKDRDKECARRTEYQRSFYGHGHLPRVRPAREGTPMLIAALQSRQTDARNNEAGSLPESATGARSSPTHAPQSPLPLQPERNRWSAAAPNPGPSARPCRRRSGCCPAGRRRGGSDRRPSPACNGGFVQVRHACLHQDLVNTEAEDSAPACPSLQLTAVSREAWSASI